MTAFGYEFDGQPAAPVHMFADALEAASQGQPFDMTAETALAALHLDGEEPDGATLMQRLLVVDPAQAPSYSDLRRALDVQTGAARLLARTNEHQANEQEETLAQIFGAAVTRQINREGDICEGARELALGSTRDDIISPETRAAVLAAAEADSDSDMPEWARGMMEEMPPAVMLSLLEMALDHLEERRRGAGFGLGSLLGRGGLGGRIIIVRGGGFRDMNELGDLLGLGDPDGEIDLRDFDDRRHHPYDDEF